MEQLSGQTDKFSMKFYTKYIQDLDNMQAQMKPILNQIQESRVLVKELQTDYAVMYSELIMSYKHQLEDFKGRFDSSGFPKNRAALLFEKINKLLKSPETLEGSGSSPDGGI